MNNLGSTRVHKAFNWNCILTNEKLLPLLEMDVSQHMLILSITKSIDYFESLQKIKCFIFFFFFFFLRLSRNGDRKVY